jgi:hypothetical protein
MGQRIVTELGRVSIRLTDFLIVMNENVLTLTSFACSLDWTESPQRGHFSLRCNILVGLIFLAFIISWCDTLLIVYGEAAVLTSYDDIARVTNF